MIYIKADNKAFPHSNFSANHIGRNALPYGDRASKRPVFMFDTPLKKGNLTYKFNPGETINIVGVADSTGVSKVVRARAGVFLLEEEDVRKIYGVGISDFASLPGGHQQHKPKLLYAEYFDLEKETTPNAWCELANISIESYEAINIHYVGFAPSDHTYQLKFVDNRTKFEFPDREPYFIVKREANALPFGDDDDYQGPRVMPPVFQTYTWTNTNMLVLLRDDGTSVKAGECRIQLIGVYRQI